MTQPSPSPVQSPRVGRIRRQLRGALALVLVAGLVACAGTERPKPKPLPANVALLGIGQVWRDQIGPVNFPLNVRVVKDHVLLASSAGTVVSLDAHSGREDWRYNTAEGVSAGVGGDGRLAAVVTGANQLVAIEGGRELWKEKLSAQAFTAPLVSGGRVFVVTADRAVSAYDGKTGRRLWQQQRPGEPLILRQPSVLLAYEDQLIVGQSGRLVALNPNSGVVRWEAPVGSSRGTNDVERLVDLVGRVSRVGDVVCARAFQTSVGCVNAARGSLVWSKAANGSSGVTGDAERVIGVEADGTLIAWKRLDGERLWSTDRLQYRSLGQPLLLGKSAMVGDSEGTLHFFSREDGSALNRVATDGSPIVGGPAMADGTLVVVTRNGGVFGFAPQ